MTLWSSSPGYQHASKEVDEHPETPRASSYSVTNGITSAYLFNYAPLALITLPNCLLFAVAGTMIIIIFGYSLYKDPEKL